MTTAGTRNKARLLEQAVERMPSGDDIFYGHVVEEQVRQETISDT